MSFSVTFYNRDQSVMLQPKGVRFEVGRYSKSVYGGCKEATVWAYGSREAIWEFVEYLRRPVKIVHNERGQVVWWGMVTDAKIEESRLSHTISLETMTNKLAVAYTEMSRRLTTGWSSDTVSIAEYGTFERLFSHREIGTDAAEQRRDTLLQVYKNPIIQTSFRSSKIKGESRAKITMRGWFEAMRRRYYDNDQGLEEYTNFGPGAQEIGARDLSHAGQSFQLSSAAGWTATEIWLPIYKVGTPADNLDISLYSDAGGKPNASLDSAPSLAGADVPTSATWTRFVLSSGVALSTGTDYWVHVARDGGKDASNYYVIKGNEELGYESGSLLLYSQKKADWIVRDPDMDLNFKIIGSIATTTQIYNIATADGEFLSAVDIEDVSGVTTHLFRNGDYTAWKELLSLLDIGTTNDRRLLAEVTPLRRFRVYEEDAITTVNYKMDIEGNLFTSVGQPIPAEDCLVGKWVELVDFIMPTVDTSILADPSPMFIDEAEYSAETGLWRPTMTRGVRDVLSFVSEG